MRKHFLLSLLILASFLVAPVASAAGVGFVPSTGIWFSRTEFSPKESVRLFTVIINNDYAALDGTVAFYDNDTVIDTVEVKGLRKEQAQQLRVFWQPSEGSHLISARFTKAWATYDNGNRSELALSAITGVTGLPLTIGASMVAPAAPGVSAPGTFTGESVVGAVPVEIKKENNILKITPQVLGEKIVASATTSTQPAPADLIGQGQDIVDRAQQVAGTITSTAGKVTAAYEQTKSAIAKGEELWQQAQAGFEKVAPYLVPIKDGWLAITDHNDPKRVAIVLGVAIFIWIILKGLLRRKRYYDDLD